MSLVPMWVLPREGRDGRVHGQCPSGLQEESYSSRLPRRGRAESGRKQVKNHDEDVSSKPLGATTSVTREAEGRALAFLPCKMALPPRYDRTKRERHENKKWQESCSQIVRRSGWAPNTIWGSDIWGGDRWMATKVIEQEFHTYLI